MKLLTDIFQRLNIQLEISQEIPKGAGTELLGINNPDGTIRWIWPADLKEPLFLKFYAQDSFRAKMIAFFIQTVFLFGIQKRVFKLVTCSVKDTNEEAPIHPAHPTWALFTGTPGPNRKAIFYQKENARSTFIKVALNSHSSNLIQQEARMLNRINNKKIQSFNFPRVYSQTKNYITTSDLSNCYKRSGRLSELHVNAVGEINHFSSLSMPVYLLPSWNKAVSILNQLSVKKDPRIPNGLLTKLKKLIKSINSIRTVECGFMHGDFTPWNMYIGKEKLNIYDWELSAPLMPIGYDLFHFICQQGILIEQLSWQDIEARIKTQINENTLQTLSPKIKTNFDLYLDLYLLFNITFYLDTFSKQSVWHEQVTWLLRTWNQSITSALKLKESHRSLLILDAFDFLTDKKYCALKFPNISPDKLDEHSDIDLCVEQSLSNTITQYIKTHPVVANCKVIKKSYMATLKVICKDGSSISFDLIWQLKRKTMVLSDMKRLLQSTRPNAFQVNVPSDIELARYILLFYTSNNAAIPQKYYKALSVVRKSNQAIDQAILKSVTSEHQPGVTLSKIIQSNRLNQGILKLKNGIQYFLDTIKGALGNPGMVITFSGVDGAGKSTIIEVVKNKLEKMYRTKVVVLRHRPSILPILSAWTKGKEKAEQDATRTLPRQGTNTNLISSFLRYTYYYTDYLIGQFVVYYKHIWRGHIVLYDRYYFDFISDSKRSNIQLPKSFTKLGYRFLLKPSQNFFLYAKPEVIRSRKQELDTQTIQQLTNDYKYLFEQLNKKQSQKQYCSIENINLDETIDLILNNLTQKVA